MPYKKKEIVQNWLKIQKYLYQLLFLNKNAISEYKKQYPLKRCKKQHEMNIKNMLNMPQKTVNIIPLNEKTISIV